MRVTASKKTRHLEESAIPSRVKETPTIPIKTIIQLKLLQVSQSSNGSV